MLTDFEEKIFVSDEIKDIVDFDQEEKIASLDLFVRSNDKDYKVVKIKHSLNKINIHTVCDANFIESFYKKGNDILNVYLNSTLIYNINLKTQLVYFTYKRLGDNYLLKISIKNLEGQKNGIWIWQVYERYWRKRRKIKRERQISDRIREEDERRRLRNEQYNERWQNRIVWEKNNEPWFVKKNWNAS